MGKVLEDGGEVTAVASSRHLKRQQLIESGKRKKELIRERIEARMRERAKQPFKKNQTTHSTRRCCGG